MKRIVKAALVTCAAALLPVVSLAQAPAAAGQCQMPDAEFQVYNNANTQTQPAAKAAALEAYLTQFPNSCAKETALMGLITTYNAANDNAKAISAADRVLQLDPNNLQAMFYEVYLHKAAADAITDADPKKAAAAKQPELDQAASYAQKGLAAAKPASMSDADFTTYKEAAYPTFYSVVASAALNKNDTATAIDFYKKELAFVQGDPKLAPQLQTPGQVLLDTYYLGVAYYRSEPPDYLDCTFYMTRAAAFAPDNFKAQFSPVAKYCYRKYHGKDDGYDQLMPIAQANVNPPANLATTITPAPTPAQIIAGILQTTTPDQLATSDKEYILQNGTPDQVQTVWDTMKGKAFQFPDVLVISSTPEQIQVAASDDAKQSKTADFTFNMTPPEELPARATLAQKKAYQKKQDAIAAAIAPGQTVTLSGTFDSFTPKPFMITMTDGAVILPTATKPSPAVHHTATHKATH
ncbi:MAG TPA: hypothetical protein VG714_09400 [Acidobacteriaceae bacterium]|nr:hypothetical protein [Acidobacteriaceae bacterium]